MGEKIVLSVNAGSSSIKTAAYQISPGKMPKKLADVELDNIGSSPVTLKYGASHTKDKNTKDSSGESSIDDFKSDSLNEAFSLILKHLTGDNGPIEIQTNTDINFVAHRIVHGGETTSPKVLDDKLLAYVEELSDLAPLHNASALQLIRAANCQLSSSTNVLCFDTSFHATIPTHVHSYPIDPQLAQRNHLRQYGFHGISYQFITNAVSKHLRIPAEKLNIIALHLGSGSSVCCIKNGKSIDTSMGLTPVSGLPGATRAGSVDPSLVFHCTHDAGKMSSAKSKDLHVTVAEEILNKQCGWKAMTGTTDFGEITKRAAQAKDYDDKENGPAKLAFDLFIDRILSFVGSYYLKLNGQVDALVFAGGVGERSSALRQAVVSASSCLGIRLNEDKNVQSGGSKGDVVVDISVEDAKARVLVCHTDEQVQMAIAVNEMEISWSA